MTLSRTEYNKREAVLQELEDDDTCRGCGAPNGWWADDPQRGWVYDEAHDDQRCWACDWLRDAGRRA